MNTAKTSGKPILDATSILFAFSMGNFRLIGGVMPVIGKILHEQVNFKYQVGIEGISKLEETKQKYFNTRNQTLRV